jgi:A/G-specific adenine glycosylase
MDKQRFKKIIRDHYRNHGREMPWRKTRDPYRILVSEIMLQQTQVSRVMKFYPNFIKQFPNFRALARARANTVLRAWQGLGYNRRALALHKLSMIVLEKFNGRLPRDRKALESLPGVGTGTSGAISAFAWNKREVFIETNIRRVFIHFFFPQRHGVTDDEVKRYTQSTLPRTNPREWYWALMDYGAMLGSAPKDHDRATNPNRRSAGYKKQAGFKGSDRELRGKILRLLLKKKRISPKTLSIEVGETLRRMRMIGNVLEKEGFIKQKKDIIQLSH